MVMDTAFRINAARSEMVSDLLEAYKQLSAAGVVRDEQFEQLNLRFDQEAGLSILGAIDTIQVHGYAYDAVELGSGFEKKVHFPREFLVRLNLVKVDREMDTET